jgi:predicted amidohydrolase
MSINHKHLKDEPMSASRIVNLALVQMTCSTDPQSNVDKAEEQIAAAAQRGANIVCLQEVSTRSIPAKPKITRISIWQKRYQVLPAAVCRRRREKIK